MDYLNLMVAFNRLSLDKFASIVKKEGAMLCDRLADQLQGPKGGFRSFPCKPGE